MTDATKKKNKNDDDDRGIFIWIFLGILLILILWWLFSGRKNTGGGGSTPLTSCNPSLWTSKPVVVPEAFTAEFTGYDECAAQTYGQINNKQAFILCKDGSVMFITGDSFTGTETACTDCKIYYTENFSLTLNSESPPHMPISLDADSPLPPPVSGACPQNPYPYCDTESGEFSNVYITLNCHASTQLVQSFIQKGKLTGFDDPKIVKCCKTPDICRAAGVTKFPTVQCNSGGTASSPIGRKIQGFCP
jgi:hypothetical protein